MFVSSAVMLSRTFPQRQLPVALAFHSASISFAGLTYPYIMDYILENFKLRGTLLIISGYLLNNLPISIFFPYTLSNKDKERSTRQFKVKGWRHETDMNKLNKRLFLACKCRDELKAKSNFKVTSKDDMEIFSVSRNLKILENKVDLKCSNENVTTDQPVTNGTQSKTVSADEKGKWLKRKCGSAKKYMSDILSIPYVAILVATGLIIATQNGYLSFRI